MTEIVLCPEGKQVTLLEVFSSFQKILLSLAENSIPSLSITCMGIKGGALSSMTRIVIEPCAPPMPMGTLASPMTLA